MDQAIATWLPIKDTNMANTEVTVTVTVAVSDGRYASWTLPLDDERIEMAEYMLRSTLGNPHQEA